ncbi:calcium-binding protein [Nitrospira moscoviensis]|uniref:Haemolysin-type calcium binding-related domain-containing protein n=1 Tax=Nitrospira moscoviensis TaxID=42253 RepID=A0A0K2G9D8_NITMO|nr:calcium-binding protein [Nitrospira moscoviensis]ALA57586.1 hypothetical protein NITMOv2_1155 [Nitrospira moscoviensis]
MALPAGLNNLAKLTLLASDESYFSPQFPVDIGSLLKPLLDTPSYNVDPKYDIIPALSFRVDRRELVDSTGFKYIAFRNDVTNEVIIAFGGTDGVNAQDWAANVEHLGWNQWQNGGRDLVFSYLSGLRNPDENPFTGKIHFTGQSLGGALAQYATYEYVQSQQLIATQNNTTFDASRITLTTFNALGGQLGLQRNSSGFNPSILNGLGASAHFVIDGDLVSRLGGGHVGGSVYQLDFVSTQINPETGQPYFLDLIGGHRIETGFYANLAPLVTFDEARALTPTEVSQYYLPMASLQKTAALLGNILNGKDIAPLESVPRLVAGLFAGMTFGDPAELDKLAKVVLSNLHAAGKLSDGAYTAWNGARLPLAIVSKPFTLAITPVSLLAAGLLDAMDAGLDAIQSALSSVRQFFNLTTGPTVPLNMSQHELEMKARVFLASVPGALSASDPLAQELASMQVNPDELAQRLLTTTGSTWRTEILAYLREQLPNPADKVEANGLAVAFYETLSATPGLDSSDFNLFAQERDAFITDTASGFANAMSDFTQKIANVAFNLGQTLASFTDIQLIDQAYAAELNDPRLSSSARGAVEDARDIVRRAGQTVVIQTGVGGNPFETPGYVPGGASSATVEEKLGEDFRLSLPFAAGAGGQRVSLQLQGPQVNQLRVMTAEGTQAIGANGMFQLVVPEGADQVRFTLLASDEISSDATVTLSATLMDENSQATHTTQIESTITVKAFVGNTDNRYETYTEDWSSITDPTVGVAMGAGGLLHQTLIGGAGPDFATAFANAFGDDTIYGNGGNDILSAARGHDVLYGGEGDDRLRGDHVDDIVDEPWEGPDPDPRGTFRGRDYVDGEGGNDVLGGGGGDDRLIGGPGDDELWGDAYTNGYVIQHPDGSATLVSMTGVLQPGDDVLEGGEGNDTLSGDGGDDTLDGGPGADLLIGDTQQGLELIYPMVPGDDYLVGGDGNDELQGNAGHDVLLGGDGDDRLYGDDSGVDPSQEGDDWLEGGDGADFVAGRGGDDTLIGGNDADVLFADAGNDTLIGGDGDDTGFGGEGDDEIIAGAGADQFDGEAGDDVMFGDDGNDLLLGGDGLDELDGGAGDDVLLGGADNDTLFGGEGNDELQGNAGDDLLAGDTGDDRIFGQKGNDELFGGDGNDGLRGDDGDDVIEGGAGDDTLVGDADGQIGGTGGNDLLNGGIGNDVLVGGGGQDTYRYELGDGFDVIVDAAGEGNRLVFGAGISSTAIVATVGFNDSLVVRTGSGSDAVEIINFGTANLAGSHPIDTFEFSDGTVLTYSQMVTSGLGISGGAGNDTLIGSLQGEQMYGGAGNDTLQGLDGADTLLGEDGADTLEGGADNDVLVGGVGDDTLLGGSGDDRLLGGAGADWLQGEIGADTLDGGIGDDMLHGGDGDDLLNGGAGNDSFDGGVGNDVLAGGLGDDQLLGGAGNDTYRFNLGDGLDSISDTVDAGEGNRVLFGAGITAATVSLTTNFGQVMVRPGATFEGVMVGASGEDPLGFHAVDLFEFADGTTLTYADLVARGFEIEGTEFDDFLFGTTVVDRFRGGLGNDWLEGGAGNDAYFFNAGDSIDTIVDTAALGAGNELVFGPGIASADLRLDLAADQSDPSLRDLLIHVGTNGDAVQIDTFDRNNVLGSRGVESFRFADASTLTYEQLLARGFDLTGTDGDDQIDGTTMADRVQAGDGSDVVKTGLGDDQLDGSTGDDRLFGGQGNDTYVFGSGSGHDTIVEFQGSQDRISMAAGVLPSDVVVTRDGNDLVLSLNGGADRLTVSLYFLAPPLQIEEVAFADGTVWDRTVIENLTRPAIAGTAGNDVLVGTSSDDRLLGLSGNDELSGLAGNDQLDGGTGADLLAGGSEDDTYIVDDPGDVVTELANEGVDTVLSSVTCTLEVHVENLTLTGTAAINGTGNELDNVLTGNSFANVLTGGQGNDTYIAGAEDTVVEASSEGTDTIHTNANTTLGANVENLSLVGSAPLVGTGNALDNVLQADGSISVLAGGAGNDTYLIGPNGDDILVETASGGIDTVIAAHDYRLPANIENLTLLDPRIPDFASFSLIPYGASEKAVAGFGNNLANILTGGRANNVLDGGLGADTLIGGAGDDTYLVDNGGDSVIEQMNEGTDSVRSTVSYSLSANVENLTLTGLASINGTGNALNNDLRGNEAANVLDGGAGDDSLMGFGGADTYLFGRGSGRDIVFDSGTAGEIDTIQLAPDVNPSDVGVYRREYGLVLAIAGTMDEITLASFFDAPGYDQKQVRFNDGTVWNNAELRARALTVGGTITGTIGDDQLTGSAGHDVLIGQAGNDVLTGGLGNDWIYGDATSQSAFGPQVIGNDTLVGGAGDDVLVDLRGTNVFDGGAGNDTLFVGTGQDTILFGRGAGLDSLTLDTNAGDLDLIQIAPDVSPNDVMLTRSVQRATGTNLIDLTIPTTGDRLTVNVSYVGIGSETTPQAAVLFGDGTRWDLMWAPVAPVASGPDVLESAFPATVAGLGGDDTYLFGSSGIPGAYAAIEAPGGGIDTVQSFFSYTLDAQVENLILAESNSSVIPNAGRGTGNELDNLIIGNTGDNILDGGAGNDVLVGGIFLELEGPPYLTGTGSDILIGGAGDDVLMEDAGNFSFTGGSVFLDNTLDSQERVPRRADDLFIGGTGNDTYIVHSQQQTVVEFENEGTDTVRSTVSYVLGEHIENLVLGSPPTVFDEEGNIVPPPPLNGTGNELDNVLIGFEDANILSGLAGRDTLVGRLGNDTLRGGTGHDIYVFNLGDGIDTIEDTAAVGEGNRIQFGAGISRNGLTVTHDDVARMLTIQVASSGTDRLVLTNFDPTGANGSLVVETLAFADGSEVSLASLLGPTITMWGTENNDVLVGTAGADGIDAGAGNDTVYANGGDDLVLAGEGDDVVTGDEGVDTISGGGGTDYLYGGDGDDVVNGDDGNDSLAGNAGNDTLTGGLGNDVLGGGDGDDVLSGEAGNDSFYGGLGNDQISGGDGDDSVSGEAGADTILGGTGGDYLYGGDGDDVLDGQDGNDVVVGEAGVDVVQGGAGNDVLNGGAGADQLSGGEGDDVLYIDGADTIVNGGAGYDSVTVLTPDAVTLDATAGQVEFVQGNSGNDVLTAAGSAAGRTLYGGDGNDQITGGDGNDGLAGQGGNDTVFGGLGNDVISGSDGDDALYGEAGNDTFYGGAGNDLLTGGEGDDVLNGEDGVDTVFAGNGSDYLYGGQGDDALDGEAGNDVLVGETGNDVLNGGAGNDVLNGGTGADQLNGGDGDDSLYIDAADTIVNGGVGYDSVTVVGLEAATLDAAAAQVELAVGSSGSDVFTAAGSLSNVTFYGGEGNDQLTGGDGNDVLIGQAGNDTLAGGLGNDSLNGGEGDDILNGGAGNDAFYAGAGTDLVSGGDGDDSLSGEGGADTLSAGSGQDYLYGGDGDDVLNGEEGNDVLSGDGGNDTLTGGLGNDYLAGGLGNDQYSFSRGDGADAISENDATVGNSDRLLFGSTINPLDLVISRQADSLRLAIYGSSDQVVIENWYLGEARQVETLLAGNGELLLNSQVDQLIQAMASFSQQTGLTWEQGIEQRPQDVQAVLAASWH